MRAAKRARYAPPPSFQLGNDLIDNMLLSIDPGRGRSGKIELARVAAQADATKKPAYETLIRSNPAFRDIEAKYAGLTPLEQQLANLTGQGLVNLDATGKRLAVGGREANYGTLEGVDLLSKPYRIPRSRPPMNMDFYDSEVGSPTEQRIVFSPNTGAVNPITAFIHEGRHALDDLYKRPHQKEMINFLTEEENRNAGIPVDAWLQPLLEGAQQIISAPNFPRDYKYGGTGGFKENVDASFAALGSSPGASPVTNFQEAKNSFAATPDDTGDSFMRLSEFPAFMTETLGNSRVPWLKARAATAALPGIGDASRRFIKENLRTMYRDYDELTNGDLSNARGPYGDVNQAFYDRYNELRNPNWGNSPDATRDAIRVAIAAGSPGALGEAKPTLTVGDPFPAPKYTHRAKGGFVKIPQKYNINDEKIFQFLQFLKGM